MKEKIEKFLEYLKESKKIVFFGGAGVSTESGIPDFRSKDGLYNQKDIRFENYSPEYLLSSDCLHYEPKVFYEFYRQKMDTRKMKPNVTHHFLAKLEEKGRLSSVITQNIDGLHQKAGSKKVIELHGTTLINYCEKCGKRYAEDYIFENKEEIPFCEECRHLIRPFVTLYGEALPREAYEKAYEEVREADMLIVAGTSLTVQPAASLVYEFRGRHFIVINKENLGIRVREEGDLIFSLSMGEVFEELIKKGVYTCL